MMFIEISHVEYDDRYIKLWHTTAYSFIHMDSMDIEDIHEKYTHIVKLLKMKKATPYHGNRRMRKYDKVIILRMIKNLRLTV